MWNPYYNGGYAYPQSRYYRPRGASEVHPYYNRAEQEPVHPYYNRREQEPLKKVVKTIPVMDGNQAPVPAVSKAPFEAVPKAPVKARFESEDAAATKIQAVYRGYCVRKTQPLKHLKVIKAVKGEFETFKKKFQDMEQKEKLCSDSKERLRWVEGIMALLLRLDSLQGVHPEVRLIRKPLTKELLMFQETIDTFSMDSLNGQENVNTTENSDAPEAEVTDAAAPEDAEVTDAAAPEDAEVTDAAAPENAEVIDAATLQGREVVDSAAPQEAGEVHAKPEVVESMDIEGNTAEQESSEVVQDMGEIEIDVKEHEPEAQSVMNNGAVNANQSGPVLSDESMVGEGTIVEAGSAEEGHAEVPMEVQSNEEQTLTTLPEAEGETEASLPNAGNNQEVEVETAASLSNADDNQDESFVFVAPSGNLPEDASVTHAEQAADMGRSGEDMAMEAETPVRSGDGCIVPATTPQPPACVESQSPPIGELSDRALLLQVLEENRKLRDVVGKVLQWGKHQNDTIHNLTSRIEQLEQHQPPLKLLRGEEGDGRKKVVPNSRRVEKGRRSGKVGHKRLLLGDVDSEDWLSAESDDYF